MSAASRSALLVACVTGVAGVVGCSALLDWGSFTGGLPDAGDDGTAGDALAGDGHADGADDSAHTDAPVDALLVACEGGACLAAVPSGWSGPVTLFTGSGAAPCASPTFSGQGGLNAPAATCAACGCGGASGATCANPVISFFTDSSCLISSGMETAAATCAPTTTLAQSATVAAPQPTGGTCSGTGGMATTIPPTWATTGVACPITTSGDCSGGEVCATTPPAASSTLATCVMQSGVATSCTGAYSAGPQVFYTGLSDTRGCTACTCGGATGVTCSIGSPAIAWYQSLCMTPTGQSDAPSTSCLAITSPDPVKLLSTPTVSSQGSCASTGGGMPTGGAAGTGAMSFCCLP